MKKGDFCFRIQYPDSRQRKPGFKYADADCTQRAPGLARISHQISAAAADPGMSAAAPIHAEHELGALGRIPRHTGRGLQLRCRSPAESSRRAPCIHARLRRLATKTGEKCGLEAFRCFNFGIEVKSGIGNCRSGIARSRVARIVFGQPWDAYRCLERKKRM